MARLQNRTLIMALAATFHVTLPAVAAETSPEGTPHGDNPVIDLAPAEPGRTRSVPAPDPDASSAPSMWNFVLRYRPGPADNLSKLPRPILLHVPTGYSLPLELTGMREGPGLMLASRFPSFGPPTSSEGRCDTASCGDDIDGVIELEQNAPHRVQTGSLQSEIEASSRAEKGTTTFQTVPVPPGYEEAFTAIRAGTSSNPRINTEYLAYHDERGQQQRGQCDGLEEVSPMCWFQFFDPETHIYMLHRFPMKLLSQRRSIEDGWKALVASWHTRNR